MNQKVKIGANGGLLTLTDKHYKAAGGEGAIYVHNGMAYKLYHEPDKKQFPIKKLQELSGIGNPQVIVPQELIFDPTNGKPLGYVTRFVEDVEPLLKLFTRTFKNDNNISPRMIMELVKGTQKVVSDVHTSKCLIVDLNELNILAKIDPSTITPFFIDTDSYATPSFKATAIMDSVRDRRVSFTDKNGVLHYNPDTESDWFSWSILAFWLYTNIHPYRGTHPNYKPKDKQKQMDDGISVFHQGVRVPPSVNDFKLIPMRHLDWFKQVFLKGERGIPPLADSSIPLLVPNQIITIKGTDKLDVLDVSSYSGDVTSVYQFMGVYYVTTKTHIYANKKEIGTHKAHKILLSTANDGTLVLATQSGTKITFSETTSNTPIGTITSHDLFARNGCIYTMTNGKLVENSFTAFGAKTIHRINEIENVSNNSATMYDGCVIQDLLGKKFLTLPYKQGSCFSKHIPTLDPFRIVGAKSDKNVTVVLGEKGGVFHRFIIVFDRKTFSTYQIREVKDVAFSTINFTTMDNGLCVMVTDDGLELFADASTTQLIDNPPIDVSMPLFSTPDGIFFINGTFIHQLKKK